jgi:hypothetical protein
MRAILVFLGLVLLVTAATAAGYGLGIITGLDPHEMAKGGMAVGIMASLFIGMEELT